jgi:hypothetical protein
MHPFIQYQLHSLFMTSKEQSRRRRSAEKYLNNEINNSGNYGSIHCLDYYKCIFLHIPKTAGLAVSKTLFGSHGPSHLNYGWFVENFGIHTVKAYYKFTFVRNPWDRLHSAYFFLKKGGINEDNVEFAQKNLSHLNSFEQFVMEWLDEQSMDSYWHFIPQYKFITSSKNPNNIMADFVGRFENLDNDFKIVANRLGFKNISLKYVNVNSEKGSTYLKDYSKEMIDKVADLYRQDIQLLNYKFS